MTEAEIELLKTTAATAERACRHLIEAKKVVDEARALVAWYEALDRGLGSGPGSPFALKRALENFDKRTKPE